MKDAKKSAKTTTTADNKFEGFTDEERGAMKVSIVRGLRNSSRAICRLVWPLVSRRSTSRRRGGGASCMAPRTSPATLLRWHRQ
jgi:hypothetical protein